MRVLIVLETSGGGSGRHAVELADGLARRGHDVHVLYSSRRAEPRFVERLAAVPAITAGVLDMTRMFRPADIGAMRAIRRYVAAHGPFDVVHGHSTKAVIACVATAGMPLARVFTPHALRSSDPTLSPPLRLACAAVETVLARFATAVIAVSPDEHRHCRRIGIPARKLHVVVNGVGPGAAGTRGAVRAGLGLADDDVCIGFVGRLVRQKAPQRAIEALAALALDRPRLRLCLVGDGPLEPALRALAAERGVADRIVWCGGAEGEAVMPAFDIFAMPSLYEGMPYVLLEASAAGLPIVATDVGGVAAVVEPGRNGFVVPGADPAALAAALGALADDPARRAAMGRAAREAAGRYTIDRMVGETLAVYRRAGALEVRRRPAGAPA